jgi:DNA-binding response OmpR family regulator
MRILVIDDDKDVIRLLGIKLGRAGHDVDTATDGTRGIELAQEGQPDVVVLETELHGTHGHDVVREVKALSPAPLVIILSHRSSDDDIADGFAAGADDFVSKPFSPRVLAERIRVDVVRANRAPTMR